jgi:threonine dehydrogenase-like Zn-dependent dehydrogenase
MSPRVIEGIEELRSLVGQEIGVSDWLEVSQELIDAFAELQLKELSIIGCFQPSAPLTAHHTFPWTQRRNRQIILELTANGDISLDHLITHRAPFTSAPEIYGAILRGGSGWLGVVFTWNTDT